MSEHMAILVTSCYSSASIVVGTEMDMMKVDRGVNPSTKGLGLLLHFTISNKGFKIDV